MWGAHTYHAQKVIMFTDSQMEVYAQLQNGELGCPTDVEWQSPRTANVRDFPEVDGFNEVFGNGNILLVGFIDESMAECECGEDHIVYVGIRADGMLSDALTTGTMAEAIASRDIDPLALLMGAITPDNLPDPIVPTWDKAREVTPDEWPIGLDLEFEVKTDMSDFEF